MIRWPGREPHPAAVADPEQGYAIQAEVARLRRQRGESVIGYMAGCASAVTRRLME